MKKPKTIRLTWSSEIPTVAGEYLVRNKAGELSFVGVRKENGKSEWTSHLSGWWYEIKKFKGQEWAGPIK
jgi:hypothetical protein